MFRFHNKHPNNFVHKTETPGDQKVSVHLPITVQKHTQKYGILTHSLPAI